MEKTNPSVSILIGCYSMGSCCEKLNFSLIYRQTLSIFVLVVSKNVTRNEGKSKMEVPKWIGTSSVEMMCFRAAANNNNTLFGYLIKGLKGSVFKTSQNLELLMP